MNNCRICFTKEGLGKYISHLDLIRTMQRAFIRAGVHIRHTEGFNPHPHMVFALPLSVGCESVCELMDFDIVGEVDLDGLPGRLNAVLPEGIFVQAAYLAERKFKEIQWLEIQGKLIYDRDTEEDLAQHLAVFFAAPSITILKKTKKGIGSSDIVPGIQQIDFVRAGNSVISVHAVLSAQNPSLNPEHLVNALRQLAPSLAPDFAAFCRTNVLDSALHSFR